MWLFAGVRDVFSIAEGSSGSGTIARVYLISTIDQGVFGMLRFRMEDNSVRAVSFVLDISLLYSSFEAYSLVASLRIKIRPSSSTLTKLSANSTLQIGTPESFHDVTRKYFVLIESGTRGSIFSRKGN